MTDKELKEKAKEERQVKVYWKITARAREVQELIIAVVGLVILLVVAGFILLSN